MYGATETAPALAVNTPMHYRAGTVGRLLPGIEHRLEPVPGLDEGRRLFVRGPNVMLGPLWLEQGKHGQARDLLQRVVDAQPRNPVPWFHLARARLALGEKKAAGEALARARELGMRGPAIAELQKAIDAASD